MGVSIETTDQWAWLSFLTAGIISLILVHSCDQLSTKYTVGGGAFTFLREINHGGFAGSLSWILILSFILTMSMYALSFGHYYSNRTS